MIGHLVRAVVCFVVAAVLGLFLLIGVMVPLPPDPTLDQVIEPVWHGFTAEVDLRLFGSERKLAAARELVALDPELSGIGRDGAIYLARSDPDHQARATWQARLAKVSGNASAPSPPMNDTTTTVVAGSSASGTTLVTTTTTPPSRRCGS